MRNSLIITATAILAGMSAASAIAEESGLEPPMDLLATQLRDQGFTCNDPKKAHMDKEASKPNERVWILQCAEITYRMTVVPDLAAKIEKLN